METVKGVTKFDKTTNGIDEDALYISEKTI